MTTLISEFMDFLVGPTPTPFSGDPAQAQHFIDEFEQLARRNRRNLLIAQPELRVELALAFINDDPMTIAWKRMIRRGSPLGPTDESIWDEFFDSFCTAWIDDAPIPAAQTPSPLISVPASAVQRTEGPPTVKTAVQAMTPIPPPITANPLSIVFATADHEPLTPVPATTTPPVPVYTLEPVVTSSTTISDSPPPRPPRSPRRPYSPRITQPTPLTDTTRISSLPPAAEEMDLLISAPTSLNPLHPSVAPVPTPAPRVTSAARQLIVSATRTTLDPLTPTTPPASNADGDKALVPCAVPTPTSLDVLTLPRIGKRKHRASSDSEDTRPHKHTFPPCQATVALASNAPTPPVPYIPPPRRPRPAPGDPTRTMSSSKTRRTVVEDDNAPRRGVKTLDDSVFARVSTQETVDSPTPAPFHAHLTPRRTFKEPREQDELANRPTSSQHHENTRKRPRNTVRSKQEQKHHDPDAIRKARIRHALTSEERHRYHTEGRNPAHFPHTLPLVSAVPPLTQHPYRKTARPTSPPPDQTATHSSKNVRTTGQQIGDRYPHRADIAETTPRPTPRHTSPAYDAVAKHLALCLAKDSDVTRVAQPLALNLEPSAVLRRWKTS
ncbi:hypothetical protein EDB86DRAFT_3082168 [Lactarius hatsudake]|nr:hypothetical protein EDB86DRAFT_3082168 [Lactarius hatsudake]